MNRGRIVGILLLALLTAGVCACGDRPDRPGNMSEESTQETAEAGYGAVLSLYKELSENNSIDAGTLSRRSEEAFFSDLYSVSVNMDVNPSRAGYALRDLNGDGTDEILLLEEDGILFAVFTRRSGQVVAVDYFSGSNNRGFIDEDGTIYKASLSKGESWGVKVTRILKDGDLDFLEFGIRDPDPGVVEPKSPNFQGLFIKKSCFFLRNSKFFRPYYFTKSRFWGMI